MWGGRLRDIEAFKHKFKFRDFVFIYVCMWALIYSIERGGSKRTLDQERRREATARGACTLGRSYQNHVACSMNASNSGAWVWLALGHESGRCMVLIAIIDGHIRLGSPEIQAAAYRYKAQREMADLTSEKLVPDWAKFEIRINRTKSSSNWWLFSASTFSTGLAVHLDSMACSWLSASYASMWST